MEWNLPPAPHTHHASYFWHYHQWLLIASGSSASLINWPLCSIWHCWLLPHSWPISPLNFHDRSLSCWAFLPWDLCFLLLWLDPSSSDHSLDIASFIHSFNTCTEHLPKGRYHDSCWNQLSRGSWNTTPEVITTHGETQRLRHLSGLFWSRVWQWHDSGPALTLGIVQKNM